jgi:hypothetical protein
MEALAVMALPPVRQTADSTLTIARTDYESVREQEAQFTALLKRFIDLLLAVTKQSNLRPNDLMLAQVESLEKYVFYKNPQTIQAEIHMTWRLHYGGKSHQDHGIEWFQCAGGRKCLIISLSSV